MKAYKTIDKNGKLESYYIVCHAAKYYDQYQLVSIPWGRVDHRIYNTPEEAGADLTKIVYDARGSIVEVVDLKITESI